MTGRMIVRDLISALLFLTRLPAGFLLRGAPPSDLARAVWAFPLIGMLVGAVSGLAYALLHHCGTPPGLAALGSLATAILLTGGLHEDGLADLADAAGAMTRERRLAVMRDSRIGSYGSLALILTTVARFQAVAVIARPDHVLPALVLAGAMGRGAMLLLAGVLRPARSEGLGTLLHPVPAGRLATGLLLPVVVALGLSRSALPVILAGSLIPLMIAWWSKSRLGGFTGDVLGAGSVLVETAILVCLASGR